MINTQTQADAAFPGCPSCQSTAWQWIFKKASYDYYCCKTCGVETVWPQPAPVVLNAIYAEQYGERTTNTTFDVVAATKRDAFRPYIQLLNAHHQIQDRKLLDIGCDLGFMLDEAAASGWNPYGIEYDVVRADTTSKRFPNVCAGDVESRQDVLTTWAGAHKFSAITMMDVLEHTRSPENVLNIVHNILADQGLLLIVVPDRSGLMRRLTRKHWIAYNDEHLWHFNRTNLADMLTKMGYAVLLQGRDANRYLPFGFLMSRLFNVLRLPTRFNFWIQKAIMKMPRAVVNLKIPYPTGGQYVLARKQ